MAWFAWTKGFPRNGNSNFETRKAPGNLGQVGHPRVNLLSLLSTDLILDYTYFQWFFYIPNAFISIHYSYLS